MIPYWKRLLGGLSFFAFSIGGIWWTWHTARLEHTFSMKGAMVFPAGAVMGLALVFFPTYREERLARGEDLSQFSGAELITPRWWVILMLALAASTVNITLLRAG